MKLVLRILLIGIITYFLSPYFEWWTGMAAALLVCFFLPSSFFNAFIAGFLGVGLVWMGLAWALDTDNNSVFSGIIVQFFPLEDPLFLILGTGLVGGLSGGMAGTTGTSFRSLIKKKKREGYYS